MSTTCKSTRREKKKVIISCFNPGTETNTTQVLPVSFQWINDLISLGDARRWKLIALLHGGCLKYGLRNSVYYKKFGTNNPFKDLISGWRKVGISIKICDLCLKQNGYNPSTNILPFIRTVPFSIQYIVQQQTRSSSKDSCNL